MTISGFLLPLALAACDEATSPPEPELERVAAVSAQPGHVNALDPSQATVEVGGTVQLVALDADDNPVAASWSSGDEAVAGVTSDGLVNALAAGTVTIEALRRGRTATARVTVEAELPPAVVDEVQVSPGSADLEAGDTVRLAVTVLDADGNLLTEVTVQWSSSDTDVASVDADGLVTAHAEGSATITAEADGVAGEASVTVSAVPPPVQRAGFYVAPDGSSGGDGSSDRPWDLRTALDHPSAVQPGDTIWVRGGTYHGSFQSGLDGAAGAPIVLRAYPGERARIDSNGSGGSTFRIDGDWTVYWGLEIMNSGTNRSSNRPAGVYVRGAHNTLVHMIVHDAGIALYTEADGTEGTEIYGSIFYNNGWNTSEGHGHALYIRNRAGSKLIRDNIMFNQFAYGIHAYTTPGGALNGIRFEGNTSFNNGSISSDSRVHSGNLLVGGEEPVRGGAVVDNMTYYSPGVGRRNVSIGYSSTRNDDVVVRGNYAVGGDIVLTVRYWDQVTVEDNTFHGPARIVELVESSLSGYAWSGNTHYRDGSASAWRHDGDSYDFAEWRSHTGLGGSDQALDGSPSGTRVFVRPSVYEPGRAHVTVYNWASLGAAQADMTGVLEPGDAYEVRNVQALFGSPIASGTYAGGALTIPLGGVTPPQPIGGSPTSPQQTGPFFDVFVVTRATP